MAGKFLSRLVADRRMQAEPVATALLHHLLQSSEPAREVMTDLAAEIHPQGDFRNLDFSEQASVEGGEGRPDLIGTNGQDVGLLIEAKFDAGLTVAQANSGYLGGVSSGGLLLFVVPRDRMAPLWPRILRGPAGLAEHEVMPTNDATQLDAPWLRSKASAERVVAVTSWQLLLDRLSSALTSGDLRSDLNQLVGLVQSQVSTDWIPVSDHDLSERTGRQLHKLRDCLKRAADSVSGGKSSLGTNDWGPARWVLDDNGQRLFWCGIRIPTWGRLGVSPLWAVYVHRDPVKRKGIKNALAPLAAAGGPGVFELDKITIGVPLIVRSHTELQGVEADLIRQLQRIKDLMGRQQPSSEDLAPTSDETQV